MSFFSVTEYALCSALSSWRQWGTGSETAPVILHPLTKDQQSQSWLLSCDEERYVVHFYKENVERLLDAVDVLYSGLGFWISPYHD